MQIQARCRVCADSEHQALEDRLKVLTKARVAEGSASTYTTGVMVEPYIRQASAVYLLVDPSAALACVRTQV